MTTNRLRRNHSGSTYRTSASSKFSRLKSSFAIFTTKFVRPFTSPAPPSPPPSPGHHHRKRRWRWPYHANERRPSATSSLFQYFGNDEHVDNAPPPPLKKKTSFENDTFYEQNRYLKKSRRSHPKLVIAAEHERRANGAPPASPLPTDDESRSIAWSLPPHPPSILVKKPSSAEIRRSSILVNSSGVSVGSRSRHGHHASSSNITVNSENLTSKEFADVTGIRIAPDHRCCSSSSSCAAGDALTQTASTRSNSLHHDGRQKLMIWDKEFWEPPNRSKKQPKRLTAADPPIIDELRRLNTRSSDQDGTVRSCVIKRGRFEISLETADDRASKKQVPSIILTTNTDN